MIKKLKNYIYIFFSNFFKKNLSEETRTDIIQFFKYVRLMIKMYNDPSLSGFDSLVHKKTFRKLYLCYDCLFFPIILLKYVFKILRAHISLLFIMPLRPRIIIIFFFFLFPNVLIYIYYFLVFWYLFIILCVIIDILIIDVYSIHDITKKQIDQFVSLLLDTGTGNLFDILIVFKTLIINFYPKWREDRLKIEKNFIYKAWIKFRIMLKEKKENVKETVKEIFIKNKLLAITKIYVKEVCVLKHYKDNFLFVLGPKKKYEKYEKMIERTLRRFRVLGDDIEFTKWWFLKLELNKYYYKRKILYIKIIEIMYTYCFYMYNYWKNELYRWYYYKIWARWYIFAVNNNIEFNFHPWYLKNIFLRNLVISIKYHLIEITKKILILLILTFFGLLLKELWMWSKGLSLCLEYSMILILIILIFVFLLLSLLIFLNGIKHVKKCKKIYFYLMFLVCLLILLILIYLFFFSCFVK